MPPLALGTRVLRPPPRPQPEHGTRKCTCSYSRFGEPGNMQRGHAGREADEAEQARMPSAVHASGYLEIPMGTEFGGEPRREPNTLRHSPPGVDTTTTTTSSSSSTTTTPSASASSSATCTGHQRASSFAFGDTKSYPPHIAARAAALAFRQADPTVTTFQSQPPASLKSILKAKASSMSRESSPSSSTRRRVTWSDDGSSLSLQITPQPCTIKTIAVEAFTINECTTEQSLNPDGKKKHTRLLRLARIGGVRRILRRHSTDAATVLRKVAGSVACAGNAIPGLAYFRQPWDYYYPPNEEEEELAVRAPSPSIDWLAAGRAYTEEDVLREFPPLVIHSDESLRRSQRRRSFTIHHPAVKLSRAHSAPTDVRHGPRPGRAHSDASDASSDSEPHFDPRCFQLPPGILDGRYGLRRPLFDEPEAVEQAQPLDGMSSPLSTSRPHALCNASATSSDTMPLLNLSLSSLASDGPPTPSNSGILHPTLPDSVEMPDGVVVIAPRPQKAWPREPYSTNTGALSWASGLTRCVVTHFLLLVLLATARPVV